MASLILTKQNLTLAKRSLTQVLNEEFKSAHLSEALAAALGFRTHAALLKTLEISNENDPEIILLQHELFFSRLTDFGFKKIQEDCDMPFLNFNTLKQQGVVIETECPRSYEIEYKSKRQKAWRNLMVSAVNAGIEQKLFSLKTDDNRWPGHEKDDRSPFVYSFDFFGTPAVASVHDAGFSELSIHAALEPTERGHNNVRAMNGGFFAGDAFGTTWLERKNGAWIQTSLHTFKIRKYLIDTVANAQVLPKGFGDRGRVIM